MSKWVELVTVDSLKPGDHIRFDSKYDNRLWTVEWSKTQPTSDIELWLVREYPDGMNAYSVRTLVATAKVFREK